ncbi:hypothetical protein QYE76_063112 [Lolium multiflorum]|uniref:Uncharacterized protein n=1 Tax=Lolium multiflorum TaxID=4521 RepID=A0AAD8S4C2_LOLMU|nr:hypothetical protein QYE76_063112 [Lolium multiflorum]
MPLSSSSATQLPACPSLAPRCGHLLLAAWTRRTRDRNPSPARPSPSPPLPATPRPSETLSSSAVTPSSFPANQSRPRRPESRQSGGARATGHRLSPAFPATSGDVVNLPALLVDVVSIEMLINMIKGSDERRGGGGREREREGQGHGEDHLLTLVPLVAMARRGEARSSGLRRRPAGRAPVDWADWELLRWRCLVEENEGDVAELMVASAWRGAAQNDGEERWPG